MRRLHPALGLSLIVGFLLLPHPAVPGVGPPNDTLPAHVNLVGRGPAGADSAMGRVTVTCRDIGNNPIPNALVRWDFSDCTDLRISADPYDPRLAVDCARHSVTGYTNGFGVASFTFIGGGRPGGGSRVQLARVFGGNPLRDELIGSVPVAAFDLDGTYGVTPADLGRWGADFFGGTHPARSDYDGDGQVTVLDLSIWGAAFFAGGSRESASSYCP